MSTATTRSGALPMSANITEQHRHTFQSLTSSDYSNFALFSCIYRRVTKRLTRRRPAWSLDLADDNRRSIRRRRKWPAREPGPEPYADAHPGEPDPRCADEELPGQEHGHAGRDVVPRDGRAVHVRGVVADKHRHGIGLGKRAGPTSRRTRH